MSKITMERRAFVNGLFKELDGLLSRYYELTKKLHEITGQVEIIENALQLSRDHLYSAMAQTNEEAPSDWQDILHRVRFVGLRTADACLIVLKERGKVTTDELLSELNEGMFRFNTPYPLREINAAMLRHPHVERDGDNWTYKKPKPKEAKIKRLETEAA